MEERLLIEQELTKMKSEYQDITLTVLNICEIIEIASKRRILLEFSEYVKKDFEYNQIHFPNKTYIDRYLKLETYARKQNKNLQNVFGLWQISDDEFKKLIDLQ